MVASDEEDELDAFMANLEKEEAAARVSKKVKLDSKLPIDDDDYPDELPLEPDAPTLDSDIKDIEADVRATIASSNPAVNKTTKKLNQLAKRELNYRPFRKDFYVEVPELTNLTDDDVRELRLSLENIKVIGRSCPKPATCWAYCGLSRKIMDVLKKSNYLKPTPIQAQAIPAIMSGRDVIGIAKTGCGKTLAFILPMFRHILDQPKLERGDGPIAMVITPTRELSTQICSDIQKFTKHLGLRVVAVYGGPNISEQIGMLKPGAEIVVCTPGRMIEILTVNSGRVTNLNRCTFLVLDEADRLFDMGFEKQIRSIVDLIRPDRQTVMFSATFPKIMEAHARKILTKPVEIQVGGRSIVCKDVTQFIEIIEEDDKFLRLVEILQKHVDQKFSAIVFVSKQEKAESLLEDLMQAYSPNCLVLHGGIDKDDRDSTFARFKSGQARVLVATSVAARGLDVKNCICVVNYDCTNHYEDYVHRCGRTGRAGNKGYAYTFITPDQGQYAADIIKALELSENSVPEELQNLWDTFKSESERLGKKVWTSSGFSGRGFKFDEAEAQLEKEKKKHQKKSLGLQNESDDEEEDTNVVADELATDSRDDGEANGSTKISSEPKSLAKQLVEQRAQALNAMLGITSAKKLETPKIESQLSVAAPTAQAPAAERQIKMNRKFEINDYHQQVRRRLTSKETLAKVSESCEVGITVRGQYCAPGDRPLEPKLFLMLEGSSEQSLEKAHKELLLVVKDEYTRINAAPSSRGRYKLL